MQVVVEQAQEYVRSFCRGSGLGRRRFVVGVGVVARELAMSFPIPLGIAHGAALLFCLRENACPSSRERERAPLHLVSPLPLLARPSPAMSHEPESHAKRPRTTFFDSAPNLNPTRKPPPSLYQPSPSSSSAPLASTDPAHPDATKGRKRDRASAPNGNFRGYYARRRAIVPSAGGVGAAAPRAVDAPDERLALVPPEWLRGKRVLDVGCNGGVVTVEVAQHALAAKVTGVDIDADLVRAARKHGALLSALTGPAHTVRGTDAALPRPQPSSCGRAKPRSSASSTRRPTWRTPTARRARPRPATPSHLSTSTTRPSRPSPRPRARRPTSPCRSRACSATSRRRAASSRRTTRSPRLRRSASCAGASARSCRSRSRRSRTTFGSSRPTGSTRRSPTTATATTSSWRASLSLSLSSASSPSSAR